MKTQELLKECLDHSVKLVKHPETNMMISYLGYQCDQSTRIP